MPRTLRRRTTMSNVELAPMANIRETDVEIVGEGNGNPRRGGDEGIDDGFDVPGSSRPTNGTPRTPLPRSPSPAPGPGRGGYLPVPTDPAVGGIPGKKPLNVNTYATKKTVAQGMMDLALLTANANQLRYVIESGKYGNIGINYYVSMTLISLSILMQLVIGIALIFMGRYDVSHDRQAVKADRLNNWIVLGVFIITIINVFISSFAIEPMSPALLRSAFSEHTERITERIVEAGNVP
ncbi:ninjurin-2-like [Palaemon carinicauda]|uniref:ninjurin-2-like n=1 Tax=Palaemon carinicauda TaxID=392227 RepID=UPI0035B593E8